MPMHIGISAFYLIVIVEHNRKHDVVHKAAGHKGHINTVNEIYVRHLARFENKSMIHV